MEKGGVLVDKIRQNPQDQHDPGEHRQNQIVKMLLQDQEEMILMNPMIPEKILENLDMDLVAQGLVLLNHGDHFEDHDLSIQDGPEGMHNMHVICGFTFHGITGPEN